MNPQLGVLLLAIGLSQVAGVPNKHLPDASLMKFMIQSRELRSNNPARSLSCFDYYVPILDGIAEQYKLDYAKCLDDAQDSRDNINDSTAEDRLRINNTALNACQALQVCSNEGAALDFFECYTKTGSENAKSMYEISADSSELLAEVREEYRTIEIKQFSCTNQSERNYVECTASTVGELQLCLTGAAPVPTAPPSTELPSTAAPEETTTEEPVTTTISDESSSDAPEPSTSEEPNDTTDESSSVDPENPEISTTEAAEEDSNNRQKFPEEDMRVANSEVNNILDNLKLWLKRH